MNVEEEQMVPPSHLDPVVYQAGLKYAESLRDYAKALAHLEQALKAYVGEKHETI